MLCLQIRIYAVRNYDNEGLDLSSKYYLEAQSFNTQNQEESNSNHNIIATILYLTSILPIGLMPAAAILAIVLLPYLKKHLDDKIPQYINEYVLFGIIIFMSILLNIAFLIFHIFAIVRLFQYTHEISIENDMEDSSYVYPALFHLIGSVMPLLSTSLMSICIDRSWNIPLILNFIYLAYFLPYMLIAFIDNPVQATFVYVLLVILIVIVFVVLFGFSGKLVYIRDKVKKHNLYCILGTNFATISLVYFLICAILILNFGGFNNFTELRSLLWPVAGAVIIAAGAYFAKRLNK